MQQELWAGNLRTKFNQLAGGYAAAEHLVQVAAERDDAPRSRFACQQLRSGARACSAGGKGMQRQHSQATKASIISLRQPEKNRFRHMSFVALQHWLTCRIVPGCNILMS